MLSRTDPFARNVQRKRPVEVFTEPFFVVHGDRGPGERAEAGLARCGVGQHWSPGVFQFGQREHFLSALPYAMAFFADVMDEGERRVACR
jgi:hypothetical protein